MKLEWKCPKCGSETYEIQELSMYGRYGALSRLYRFIAVICSGCGYTELYYREKTPFW